MNDEDRKKVKKLAPQGFTSTVGKSFFFREKRFCQEIKKSRKLGNKKGKKKTTSKF